jgi:hypothetical protein
MNAKKGTLILSSQKVAKVAGIIRTVDLAPAKCSIAIKFLWPRVRIERAATGYQDFLLLVACGPLELCVPSADADCVWHEHILQTKKYASDCRRIFGRLLHHDDFAGAWGIDDLRKQQERFRRSQQAIVELKRKGWV